jgi:hypothetical protein
MARLNMQAAVRWAGSGPDQILAGTSTYQRIPMVLALSVTDMDGVGIEQLRAEEVHVGYQIQPEGTEAPFAAISDFQHNGPTAGSLRGAGWYSCIVNPPAAGGWFQDEIFLCVTVQRPGASGQDRGQALVLARYHQFH